MRLLRFYALAALALTTCPGLAIEFINTNAYLVPTDQIVEAETWVMADQIDMGGVQQADFFSIARSNVVAGVSEKDLWALAETITVRGTVSDAARLAGRNVSLEGRVLGNLLAAGETVQLGDHCEVGGNAALIGARVVANGHLLGDVRIIARQVTISGHIEGNIRIHADDIVVLKGARIDGDITYTSPKELFLDNTVQQGGSLVRTLGTKAEPRPLFEGLLVQIALLLGSLLLAAPFLAVFPTVAGRALYGLRIASWRCSLIGLAAFCLIPLLCLFSALTLFGLPLAIVLACAFVILVYLSKIIVALAVGQWVLRRTGPTTFGQTLLTLVVGLLLIYSLTSIPRMGLSVWLVVTMWGMGALILGLLSAGQAVGLPVPDGQTEKTDGSGNGL